MNAKFKLKANRISCDESIKALPDFLCGIFARFDEKKKSGHSTDAKSIVSGQLDSHRATRMLMIVITFIVSSYKTLLQPSKLDEEPFHRHWSLRLTVIISQ